MVAPCNNRIAEAATNRPAPPTVPGADLVVNDCVHTDETRGDSREQWPHATQDTRPRSAAGARRLVLFHHDPDHDVDTLDAIAREIALAMPGSVLKREGLPPSL